MTTATEAAIKALKTALQAGTILPPVRRNAVLDQVFDSLTLNDGVTVNRALILRDGTGGVVEQALGFNSGQFVVLHDAEVEWLVCAPEGDDLDAQFDAGLAEIAARINADPTLGGTVILAQIREAPARDTDVAGANPVKTAAIKVELTIQTGNQPL